MSNTTSGSQTTSSGTASNPANNSSSGPGESASPTTQAPTAEQIVSSPLFQAVVGGGAAGGLVLGTLVCLLIVGFCSRRKRRSGEEMSTHSRDLSHRKPVPAPYAKVQEPTISGATDETGWEKHLPQGKDDRSIVKIFDSIFTLVHFHMEGYYEAKSDEIPSSAIASIERLVPGELPFKLLAMTESVSILEGVLLRWMIHRISLRSSESDSLLPPMYTQVPAKAKWHMERDEAVDGARAESENGFRDAFSRWRRLTAFVTPKPSSDPEYKRRTDKAIDRAVQDLADAFSPWNTPNKSEANRFQSLREILLQVSDAGILLFAQPSTFVFDWSLGSRSPPNTVVVAPALLKRLDERATVLETPQVMIAAKRARL